MLARDRVRLTLDGRAYTLTPSLRAAMRLERVYGMDVVLKGIGEGNASIMAAVVRECADLDSHLNTILDSLSRPSLLVNLMALQAPLTGLVFAMHGVEPDHKPAEPQPGAKPITFAEHLAQLYRFGAGWLGWTPGVTLNATPAEITEAVAGHVDMLKAIHGAADDKPAPVDLDTKARAIFGGLAQRFRDRNPQAA